MNTPLQDTNKRLASHYAAVSRRLWGVPPRPVMLKVEPAQVEALRAKVQARLATGTTREQQEEFIKAQCREKGFCYKTIMAADLSGDALQARNQIIVDFKERWPLANANHLGARFNRTPEQIRELLASFKVKHPDRPITPEAIAEIHRLRSEGVTHANIGEVFGVTTDTIRYHLRKARRK